MAKKIGVILMGLFVLVFSGVNLYFYFDKKGGASSIMSGMATIELPLGLNMSIVLFIGQWAILLLIVFFAYMKFLKHKKTEEIKSQNFVVPCTLKKSETQLDTLYNAIKDKKNLSVGSIAKAFKIEKEKALEWAKILENNDLVIIEYPAFSDPEVKLKLSEEEFKLQQEKQKKDKTKEQKLCADKKKT